MPGGSSGGSAAAVAARLAPAATATDTGGSIRQPAALCGVTGLKPTYGRVSRFGMIAFASSLDQGGLITRSAEDSALLLTAMAGFDARDSTSVELPVPDYAATLEQPLKGLKIGLLKEFFDEGLDPENARRIRDALEVLREQGATLKEVSLPNLPLSVPTYYVVAPAECSSNLARFDGVRYGYRCHDPRDLLDLYQRSRGEGFGAEVKRRIMTGTYVLSAGYYDAYYLKAQRVRALISADFERAFHEVDVVMGPTTPTPAFELGAKTADPVTMYLNDIYTIGANLAGLPAMSMPCGLVAGICRWACRSSAALFASRSCSTSRTAISRRPTGTAAFRRGLPDGMGNRHRAGDPRAARDALEDLLRRRHRLRCAAEHAGRPDRPGLSRACCRC